MVDEDAVGADRIKLDDTVLAHPFRTGDELLRTLPGDRPVDLRVDGGKGGRGMLVDTFPRRHRPAGYRSPTGATVPMPALASVTRPFCGTCDRTRLTADGHVRACRTEALWSSEISLGPTAWR